MFAFVLLSYKESKPVDKTGQYHHRHFGSEKNSKEENEKLNSLRKCVKALNEGDKAIVALYLEGMAYKEISTILGLSENHIAVKVKQIKSNC